MSRLFALGSLLLAGALGAAACAGQDPTARAASSSGGSGGQGVTTQSAHGGGPHSGGSGGAGGSDEDRSIADGSPTRVSCTWDFGDALDKKFGRLDGYLVSIVPPGTYECHGDSGHVHLQVQVDGAVYDVAVNTDVLLAERDVPMPDGAWSEGWHTGITFDYVKNLGLHSGAFSETTPGALAQKIEGELAAANHVSVFATGYGPTGIHDVHRHGPGTDGAIVIYPLSAKAHLLMFRFFDQSF